MFKIQGTDQEIINLFTVMVEKNMKQLLKKYGTKKARQEAMNQVKFGQVQQLSLLK